MKCKKKIVLTYGTFDLFHVGHLNLLNRLKALGDYLIVGVSTDEFNMEKNKKTIVNFSDRLKIVQNIKSVDFVIPEFSWDQKVEDIKKYNVDVFGMGHDWDGHFDELKQYCEVIYLPRTDGVSSTQLKQTINFFNKEHIIEQMKTALDTMSTIFSKFD